MTISTFHMIDLREDRNPAHLLLEPLTTVPGTPSLLQPCSCLLKMTFFLENLEVVSSLAVNIWGMPWARGQSWTYPGQHQDSLHRCLFQRQLSFQGIHATDLMTIKRLFTTGTVIVTIAGCPGRQAEGCAPDLPLQSPHNCSMCGD